MTDLLAPQAAPVAFLVPDDYAHAAGLLGCEPAAVKAIAAVETQQRPFDVQGRPTILFERHVFHRLTGGKFDAAAPDISSPTPGGYGPASSQYARCARAADLDQAAALQAASWGAFQILGEYHAQAGSDTVEDFVASLRLNVSAHLLAFVRFVQANHRLVEAIDAKDWETFAHIYNGPAQAQHGYSRLLAEKYAALSK